MISILGKIDLNQTLDKKEYKSEMKDLQNTLNALQQKTKEMNIPVCIVFEGWSASGKGTLISKVLYPLDPRYFNVYSMNKIEENALMRPLLWSYWTKTPSKGRTTIFDKSWHRVILPGGIKKWKLTNDEIKGFYYDVNAFEKALIDDGTLIIKLFLHISKNEQKKRFKELESNEDTKWRIDAADKQQNIDYDYYIELFQHMIQNTNTSESQWSIIEANDKKFATVKIYKILINKIQDEINKRLELESYEKQDKNNEDILLEIPSISILKNVDLSKTIKEDEYKKKLELYQARMSDLCYKLYTKRKSVVILFEGWDAAGKGGNIKRLTEEIDPRGYEVITTAAPTTEELNHHYLWRFWNKMPKDGHLAIFDRTWYGRVTVERVEGFCTNEEWQRAYKEINDTELHMVNKGTIIFKFWVHIDKDEQLARFKAREVDPLKQYKITSEDWRNRDKWDLYEKAVDEMLFRTNTDYAPWIIVESNDKKYARIKVLEHVTKELELILK